jgi:hypothetical protein
MTSTRPYSSAKPQRQTYNTINLGKPVLAWAQVFSRTSHQGATRPASTRLLTADVVLAHTAKAIGKTTSKCECRNWRGPRGTDESVREIAMLNVARRVKKLESQRLDATGLAPHSDAWFAF